MGMDRPLEKQGGQRKLWIIGLAVIAVLVCAYFGVRALGGERSLRVDAQTLSFSTVQDATFRDFLPLRAEVAPLETVFVDSVEGGRVDRVLVNDGDNVAAGATLAVLSNPRLVLDVMSREAEISERLSSLSAQRIVLQGKNADADAQTAETAHKALDANRDLSVNTELHKLGVVSDMGVSIADQEARYYASRLSALKAAQASTVSMAAEQGREIQQTGARLRKNLEVVQASLQALEIRAPAAGRLTGFTIKPGQLIKEGDRLGQVDAEAAFKLIAEVDEYYLNRVEVGQMATVAFDGASVPLVVSRVIPQVSGGRFHVELIPKAPLPASARRGQNLDARITLGRDQKALVAQVGPWIEQTGGSWVFVMRPDGRSATRREITVGRRNAEQVEIVSGLRPGETIVTSEYSAYDKVDQLKISR